MTVFLTALGTFAAVIAAVMAVLAFTRSSGREREAAIQNRIDRAVAPVKEDLAGRTRDWAYERDRADAYAEELRRRGNR